MAPVNDEPMLDSVNVSEARKFASIFARAVHDERPVKIVRYKREQGVFVSRAQLLRALDHWRVTVDVVPEESGGFTLWVRELNMGSHGATLAEARTALLHDVRSYVRHYFKMWDMYRHMSDTQAQMPYVLRLSLADDDKELAQLLFGSAAQSRDSRTTAVR
jgi:hypothetical protein